MFALGGMTQMYQPDEFIEVTVLTVRLVFLDRLLTDMRTPL